MVDLGSRVDEGSKELYDTKWMNASAPRAWLFNEISNTRVKSCSVTRWRQMCLTELSLGLLRRYLSSSSYV